MVVHVKKLFKLDFHNNGKKQHIYLMNKAVWLSIVRERSKLRFDFYKIFLISNLQGFSEIHTTFFYMEQMVAKRLDTNTVTTFQCKLFSPAKRKTDKV